MKRIWIPAIAIVALAAAVITAPAHASAGFKNLEVGEGAFDFTLRTLDGDLHTLSKSLGEKGVAVVFWAAWSSRSVDLLRDLQAMYAKYGAEKFMVVGVNVEHPEWDPAEVPKIKKAGEDAGVTFPMLVDQDLAVFNEYGVVAVPSAIVLNNEGTVKAMISGYGSINHDELAEAIAVLVEGKEAIEKKPTAVSQRIHGKGRSEQHTNMAKMLVGKKQYKRAVKPLEKAIKDDPDYAPAYRLMAEVYEELGKPEEAAAATKKAEAAEALHAKPVAPDADAPDQPPAQEAPEKEKKTSSKDESRLETEVLRRAG